MSKIMNSKRISMKRNGINVVQLDNLLVKKISSLLEVDEKP